MSQPAVVMNDRIMGQCAIHLIPGPLGAPIPSPPLPFSAPLLTGLATTVLIAGKPAAVQGSSGMNTPPHAGLHPSDPNMAPPSQQGRVLMGSARVLVEGKGAAYTGCQVAMCNMVPGMIQGTATTVMIGS